MTWERIKTPLGGKSIGVTVAWRKQGGRESACLCVSLGKEAAARLGLARGVHDGKRHRVVVERDRMRGRLRLSLAPASDRRDETRSLAWKDASCCITIPMPDVHLDGQKPAQEASFTISDDGRYLEVKLPHWACPVVQVTGGRAA